MGMDSWLSLENRPTTIPFTLKDYPGQVTVRYGANTDPVKAGFDSLPSFPLDLRATLGYPCMHAIIDPYAGSGYRALCGWGLAGRLVKSIRTSLGETRFQAPVTSSTSSTVISLWP